MRKKKQNIYKILAASICTVILIVIMVSMSIRPNNLLGSVYNVNDLEKNIDKIKVGDIINYDLNGQSKWKVIYIDKGNGTVDVVSTNTLAQITLSTKEDFENALDILQTEANKYTDNKNAIKARSATRADLDNFGFEDEFWTADTYNLSLAYSGGKIEYIDPEKQNNDFYMLPFIEYQVANGYNYHQGDTFTANINGINDWFVLTANSNSLILMPKDPIHIDVKNNDEFMECPECVYNNKLNSFYQDRVYNVGTLMQSCVGSCCQESCINDNSTIKTYYSTNHKDKKIMRGWFSSGSGEGQCHQFKKLCKKLCSFYYV